MSQQFFTDVITPQQLHAILHTGDLVVLDASIGPVGKMVKPNQVWPNTIIPTAKFFDLEGNFSDLISEFSHTMPSAEQFIEEARQLGINNTSQIVVYDCYGIFSSARAWWMFKAMGHKHVAVLQGGLPQWITQGYKIEQAQECSGHKSIVKPGNFEGKYHKQYFSDKFDVQAALAAKQSAVIDARAMLRFYGQMAEPRKGIRSGHMPGAINLPYTELLLSGRFVSREQLVDLFSGKVNSADSLIMTCGSGVTACVLALAADLCGYRSISVYDGSWSEWGKLVEFPVTTE
ncbi:MAG: sulfurtransferase [Alteromonadaceae bacterium]|nr:sulfurtransferase [Alteromonadaceae bacterium]